MQQTEKSALALKDIRRQQILIVGKGGEGVVLIGELLGLAATLDGKFASQRSTYGASQRGETLFSEIIVSNKPVQFPFVESPTLFIAMSPQGFEAYSNRIKDTKNTEIFIDSTYDYDLGDLDTKGKVNKVPARQLAIDNKIPMASNMIMLSNFIKKTSLLSKDSLKQALVNKISDKLLKQNQKAFELGYKI